MKAMHPPALKLFLVAISAMSFSCSTGEGGINHREEVSDYATTAAGSSAELTPEQAAAFDALNTLQTHTDQLNRLYSTFPNIDEHCYPPDSSFTISRAQLLVVMNQFVTQHCSNLLQEQRDALAEASVLAQENYAVLYCSNKADQHQCVNGLPISGTWVLPGLLGRRDLVLQW